MVTFDHAAMTTLVTGASSGIGRAFAVALADRGSDLVLVARRADRLDRLAEELRARTGVRVDVVPADLARPDAPAAVRDEIAARGQRVTALINNAGFGTWGPFADEDSGRLDEEIALDVAAPVRLTRAFLPDVRAARGYVVNVASMAAYSPTPRMAVYGASKAFVLSFTEALWAELRDQGVTVFALSPGATATEFNRVVGTGDATAGVRPRRPQDVVATALRHLDRRHPGPSVVDGAGNRAAATLIRLLDRRTTVRLMERLTDPARRATGGGPVPANVSHTAP